MNSNVQDDSDFIQWFIAIAGGHYILIAVFGIFLIALFGLFDKCIIYTIVHKEHDPPLNHFSTMCLEAYTAHPKLWDLLMSTIALLGYCSIMIYGYVIYGFSGIIVFALGLLPLWFPFFRGCTVKERAARVQSVEEVSEDEDWLVLQPKSDCAGEDSLS